MRRAARAGTGLPRPEHSGPLWLELAATNLELGPTRAERRFKRLLALGALAVVLVVVGRPVISWCVAQPEFAEFSPILGPPVIIGVLGLFAFVIALALHRPKPDRQL